MAVVLLAVELGDWGSRSSALKISTCTAFELLLPLVPLGSQKSTQDY